MVALYRMGRQQEAIRAFQRCKRALYTQLGVQPMTETVKWHAAVQAHDDALLLPASASRERARPLLGRKNEVARLENYLRPARRRFSLLLVEGVAGIGKSRLLDELEARLDGQHAVRWRCDGLNAEVPFLAITGALSNLGRGAVPDEDQRRLVDPPGATPIDALRLLDLLVAKAARFAPLLILIDRLDLADASSVSAIGYLQRRLVDEPVTVIATSRSTTAAHPPMSHLDWTARIRLGRLTEQDLAPLQIPGLHAKTAGHPVFVAACTNSGGEQGNPPRVDVRDWVLAWCRAAGTTTVATLTAAATLRQPFSPELLAAVLQVGAVGLAEQLEGLCAHGLLLQHGSQYGFCDPPVRQILLDNTSSTRRAAKVSVNRDVPETVELNSRWASVN